MNKGSCSSNYPKESFDSFLSDKRKGDGVLTGSALVIVLAFLVIVTGMVMAFFSSITNEQICAKAEATSITDHNLADSVASIIISQLRDATVGYAHNTDGSLNSNSPLCWASQLGLIRTYDTNAAPYTAYKLYSARNDLFTGSVTVSSDLPTSGWTSSISAYTDDLTPINGTVEK